MVMTTTAITKTVAHKQTINSFVNRNLIPDALYNDFVKLINENTQTKLCYIQLIIPP